jgi:hypothetical protein
MRLRYAGVCRVCRTNLAAATYAVYFADSRQVECPACYDARADAGVHPVEATDTIEPGNPGSSVRREYERRVAKREQRIRAAHPRIGGFLLAISDDPQTTQAWKRGAVGEQKLAHVLHTMAAHGVRMLHDRRIPGTRANIDHIAVAPSGVYVIDAKRYKGRPHLRVEGGLMRSRVEQLVVGTRDCTKLVEGIARQVDLVRGATASVEPEVPVRGMLCFVDADWPLIGGSFTVADIAVLSPKRAAKQITAPGALTQHNVAEVHATIASRFPPA